MGSESHLRDNLFKTTPEQDQYLEAILELLTNQETNEDPDHSGESDQKNGQKDLDILIFD
jgi:hypothetical protein